MHIPPSLLKTKKAIGNTNFPSLSIKKEEDEKLLSIVLI